MSDCSGDMDLGNDAASCANCNVSYDGVDKVPITGGACGHIQCNSCWQENDCFKCNSKSTDENREVHIQTPRDFRSPEPPQSSAGNGSSTSNDENKEAVHAPQIEQQAQVTAPSVGLASSSTVGAVSSPSLNAPVFAQPANAPARITVPRLASRATEGVAATPSLATITVKCINGTTVTLKVNLSCTTVQETKRLVHQQSGIAQERQHLLFRGKTMEDISRTLKSYNVTDGSTLQMGARCYGG
ncbi:hypothetical protein FOCC_FOCC000220 [Frankliniella occidentalis]|nr:hypothetical protein FOCC_FOCC000220 [Frankliniella occidentalis]